MLYQAEPLPDEFVSRREIGWENGQSRQLRNTATEANYNIQVPALGLPGSPVAWGETGGDFRKNNHSPWKYRITGGDFARAAKALANSTISL